MFSEPNDEFSCATCELVFDSVNDVKVHEWHEHHGSSSTKCEACITGFTTRGEMMNHVRIHYLYCCNFCSLNTNSWTFYKEHVSEHCKATPYVLTWETGENVHECSTCVDGFDNIDDLEAHLVKDNSQKFKESYLECMIDMSGKQASKNLLPQSKEKRHVCPVCEKGFSDVWGMYLHMTIHTREKPDLCPVSKKGFSQAWDMKETGENVHECSPCVDSFDNIDDLEAHFVNDNSQKFKESYLESMIDMNGKQASTDHFMLPDMMKPTGENNEKGFSQACGMKETGENVHECSPCVDSFDNIDDLEAHFVNDNSQKFKESYLESMIDMNGKQASTDHFMLPDVIKPTGENNEKGSSQACGMKKQKRIQTGGKAYASLVCTKCFIHVQGKNRNGHLRWTHQCPVCNISFTNAEYLKKHILHMHQQKTLVSTNDVCPLCKKAFSSALFLKEHMKIHTADKYYLCTVCKIGFRDAANMKVLMTREKPHHCPVCKKGFSYGANLKRHMEIHTGEKPHLCPVCEKGFSLVAEMKIHMRIHAVEKPDRCPVCEKGFIHSNSMKVHMRIHTGEKPHLCPVCKKSFSLSGDMTRHMRSHTGEKPYLCQVCGKGFSRASHLKVHMRIHSGEKPYVCPVCKKGFSCPSYMKSHMIIHTGEKPHVCSVCGKGFSHSGAIKRHIKTMHEKETS